MTLASTGGSITAGQVTGVGMREAWKRGEACVRVTLGRRRRREGSNLELVFLRGSVTARYLRVKPVGGSRGILGMS